MLFLIFVFFLNTESKKILNKFFFIFLKKKYIKRVDFYLQFQLLIISTSDKLTEIYTVLKNKSYLRAKCFSTDSLREFYVSRIDVIMKPWSQIEYKVIGKNILLNFLKKIIYGYYWKMNCICALNISVQTICVNYL